jgi:putative membrane protein
MKWLLGILINAVLFMALAGYFDESYYLVGFTTALAASFVLSVLNVLVRPLLILLTLPATILTLGFFLFVINAMTLEITDMLMGSSFEISNFGMALFAAIIMSLVNLVVQKTIFEPSKYKKN